METDNSSNKIHSASVLLCNQSLRPPIRTLYCTAIANREEILSLHIVEANTSHCVLKVLHL